MLPFTLQRKAKYWKASFCNPSRLKHRQNLFLSSQQFAISNELATVVWSRIDTHQEPCSCLTACGCKTFLSWSQWSGSGMPRGLLEQKAAYQRLPPIPAGVLPPPAFRIGKERGEQGGRESVEEKRVLDRVSHHQPTTLLSSLPLLLSLSYLSNSGNGRRESSHGRWLDKGEHTYQSVS